MPLKGPVVIIGAGPAGLTAASDLVRRGHDVVVLERNAVPGGLARTERYGDYLFDIGGHRFFTKIDRVNALWREWLGPELLTRPRLSRIHYRGRFFHYPLKALDALGGLGLVESLRIGASYARAALFPSAVEETFEQWVTNRFGARLYTVFFKTYTEKVWGIPCSEIRAEWAAQRIKGLSLASAVRSALFPSRKGEIKTLIEEFLYPRRGPGQMWETVAQLLQSRGQRVDYDVDVLALRHDAGRVRSVAIRQGGADQDVPVESAVISSMALSELVLALTPAAPEAVRVAARSLSYRDFLTVVLLIRSPNLFPDNWIYIHSPEVHVGRIQNFKNWSADMVPDPSVTTLGLEYFCTEGDAIWSRSDEALIDLGRTEVAQLGLASAGDIFGGTVVRQTKAYPVYDATYAGHLDTLRKYLAGFENLQTIGRNGLHMYNNQDHSMLTALLAVENLLGASHDIWSVNTERAYHEEVRLVPEDGRREERVEWEAGSSR